MKRILIIAILNLILTGCSKDVSVETNGLINEEVQEINEIELSSHQYDVNINMKDTR